MLENEIAVTRIATALYLAGMQGRPIHRDRPTHGLVFNVGCSAAYTFETGKTLECHSGECIFLPKGSHYSAKRYNVSNQKENGVYAINFLTLSDEAMDTPWVLKIKAENEMIALFSRAARAWGKKEIGFCEECLSCLYRIIKQIKRETAQYVSKQSVAGILSPAIQYINERYLTETISVARLAALCGISEVYLRKLFQRVFSLSPSVYVRNKRIHYAKELLQSEEYSITEVVGLSGFNDPAYFAREFKKTVGITPSAYRREMK